MSLATEIMLEMAKGAAVGSVIGWSTNKLAVWMLFHPKTPRKLFGLSVPLTPGLVVANHERLADSIGQAVASDLLDPETLMRHLEGVRLSEPIAEALDQERTSLLKDDRSLLDFAGSGHRPALEGLRRQLANQGVSTVLSTTGSLADGDDSVVRWFSDTFGGLADQPLDDFLTADDKIAMRDWAVGQLSDLMSRESTVALASDHVKDAVLKFRESESFETFGTMISEYLGGRIPAAAYALQETLVEYVGREDFGQIVRSKISKRLHSILTGRFPRFSKLVSQPMIEKVLKQRWVEVTEELQETIRSPELEEFIMGQLDDAASNVLEAITEALEDEDAVEQLAQWLKDETRKALPSLASSESAVASVDELINNLGRQSIRDIVSHVGSRAGDPLSRLAKAFHRWASSTEGQTRLTSATEDLLNRLFFHQPVKTLAGLIPQSEWEGAKTALAETIEDRTMKALPKILSDHLDIEEVVSQKIRAFDTDQIEDTILRVSGNELKGIVRLGGIIGLLVGAGAQAVNFLFSMNP